MQNTWKSAHPPLWQTCKVLRPWALFHETMAYVVSRSVPQIHERSCTSKPWGRSPRGLLVQLLEGVCMVYLACSYGNCCVSCYSDCLVRYDIYIAMGTAILVWNLKYNCLQAIVIVGRQMATLKCELILPGLLASIDWNPEVPEELKIGVARVWQWRREFFAQRCLPNCEEAQTHKDAQTFEAQGLWERKFSEIVSKKQIAVLSKGFVPANTSKNTMWAVKAFEAWVQLHNSCTEDEIDKGTLHRALAVSTLLMFIAVHCRS